MDTTCLALGAIVAYVTSFSSTLARAFCRYEARGLRMVLWSYRAGNFMSVMMGIEKHLLENWPYKPSSYCAYGRASN